MRPSTRLLPLAFLAAVGAARAEPPEAFFEREVRPLLADACYECHGPQKQKASLRVDSRAALLTGGDSGPAVVPGQPEKSLLVQAVLHRGDVRMPPKGKLRAEQVAVLERWVAQGVPWPAERPPADPVARGPAHWSFLPVRKPAVPAVQAAGPHADVDRFLLAALEAKGLTLSPSADRRTLIRRATFDLIGLPPTPEEVDAFLADESPGAFAKVVNRLLASPHYGERWGRHWLDVVRYADTAGETADYPAPEAYRYRNYVIAAFNADRPYDAFVREQVAGDLLARDGWAAGTVSRERYAELVTATGFLAVARRFGYDTERYEHLTIADTLDTLGQAVLGLSLGCARCHDHKYDPVSAREYYGLYGFFASTRYAFAGSERLQQTRSMVPLVPPDEARAKGAAWERQVADVQAELAALQAGVPPVVVRPLTDLDGDFELQAASQGGSLGLPANPWQAVGDVRVETGAQSPFTHVYPRGTTGAALVGSRAASLGRGLSPAVTASAGHLHVALDFKLPGPGPADRAAAYRLRLGRPGAAAVEVGIGDHLVVVNGRAAEDVGPLKANTWYHLRLDLDLTARTYRGRLGTPGDGASFAGKALDPAWDGTIDTVSISAPDVAGPRAGLHVDNLALSPTPLPTAAPAAPAPKLDGDAKKKRVAELQGRLAALLDAGPYPMAYAVWDGTGQDVRVQKRGEPDKPGAPAPRRFPDVLGGDALPAGTAGSGRLALAHWLTRPENPLTARVLVNRVWQHHFGTGLVATENDFGTRGRPPSHPELLDYLAAQFVDDGWSIKALHRRVMLSRAYQQASADDPRAAAVDPENRLLARVPRRRLDAEALRDALLALAGRLERGPGGRHPFPPLLQARFTQHGPFRADYDTPRRSVYLMAQRTRRQPYLALFDGPDPNASTARRGASTVAPQALFLMNSPFVHAQAAAFGGRLRTAAADDAGRVARGYALALGRPPDAAEMQETLAFVRQYRQAVGGAEAEVWAAVARTLVARNEFVFVD